MILHDPSSAPGLKRPGEPTGTLSEPTRRSARPTGCRTSQRRKLKRPSPTRHRPPRSCCRVPSQPARASGHVADAPPLWSRSRRACWTAGSMRRATHALLRGVQDPAQPPPRRVRATAAARGDRNAGQVLRVHDDFRRHLWRELGSEPSGRCDTLAKRPRSLAESVIGLYGATAPVREVAALRLSRADCAARRSAPRPIPVPGWAESCPASSR